MIHTIKLTAVLLLLTVSKLAFAAVILQYHHVSNDTPESTSISPLQFEAHMQYLADNDFTVVSLSELMNTIMKQQPLKDKMVAITFDDAYLDILTQGKPILDKFNYPFTIFINPNIVERNPNGYLSWQQLKDMADDGVIIANHGLEHDSLARIVHNSTDKNWRDKLTDDLLSSEKIIEEKTGQSWRYFAYPYGEFTPEIQSWLMENNFIAFSQQSGAVSLATDLTNVPRFPASKPYDKIASLRDKLYSLPFMLSLDSQNAQTIYPQNTLKSVSFNIVIDDFHKSQLNCYVSGLGKQKVEWQSDKSFTINFSQPLSTGRIRCNCTAPSISQPGRYYWYSKPWFILTEDSQWYPL
ncbi:polysaccharide deacetylase family protein [Thalassotalea profundi]|uniref:Polysaccharide deacetylase n=1 Tax=Thalassotalea profundi TaxID=2036687 RepID=A0ABQ3IWF4_9GAMM|nr:polysaccharide deacetylase family protein [Thalassotalea profundi]GHE96881.1 polysaccharide deacetylase [Thalassotalea profundi]